MFAGVRESISRGGKRGRRTFVLVHTVYCTTALQQDRIASAIERRRRGGGEPIHSSSFPMLSFFTPFFPGGLGLK